MVLTVKDLLIGYNSSSPVAGPLSLELDKGELVLLQGPNGSGKTTFLKTVAGLVRPLGGSILSEKAMLLPTRIPKVRGFSSVEFICSFLGFAAAGGPANQDTAMETLKTLGVEELAAADIASLSDGQFQKICLCAALASGRTLLLLDEPTAFLDAPSRLSLMETLRSITSETGVTVIFSSHDIAACRPYCSRTVSF